MNNKKQAHKAIKNQTQNNEQEDKTKQLQEELNKITELAKRTMADLQNIKRRQEQERGELIQMANAELIKNLLPTLDNLELALEHAPQDAQDAKEWIKGIEMSINQFKKTLQENGLLEIQCLNQEFNPDMHEAVLQDKGPKNKIIEVLQKGYTLGKRVIRHAKVKIGQG